MSLNLSILQVLEIQAFSCSDGFESTDSWFLTNVNLYCGSVSDPIVPDGDTDMKYCRLILPLAPSRTM